MSLQTGTNKFRRWVSDLDERCLTRWPIGKETSFIQRILWIGAHLGDSWIWFPGLTLCWLTGKGIWGQTGFALLTGSLIIALIVTIMKYSFRRNRPESSVGKIYYQTDPYSFPSGHAARLVNFATMATVLGPWWLGCFGWIMAVLIVTSRILLKIHYLSDILAGLLLGVISGFCWSYLFR